MTQALRAARAATSDEIVQRRVLNSVAGIIPEIPLEAKPPEIAQRVYKIAHDITGNSDPYREIKSQANQTALSLYPRLKEIVVGSDDPLLAACKLAIAGNSIDFGPQVLHTNLDAIVDSALSVPFVCDDYQQFRSEVASCTRLLYLGDNAGEIVFDKLLIEQLLEHNSQIELTFVVRETPIINDATMDDAVAVELDKLTRVVSNGSDAPATILSQCSSEMLEIFDSSDIIIAKGQGNYESLSDEEANIVFLLKCKCHVVADLLDVNVGDAVLRKR
uniref:Damage-control phosphatase ARMT1-like metal-binding domain-containing protein n=1 Tax=bacterium enrichment culture clone fosmid MGS-K1 TaxID=1549356 RepID=A0A0B5KUM7_9BACT|nr:hypothetical protein [bacterium enrichment culture clone fosmid MGS-K1]